MPDYDLGLLSDTGRELYVADAINDLTRLRLELASESLEGISERPEWGGIAASLRALGEDHQATVVDAFAAALVAVGEVSHAGEDHEFVANGIDTVEMLLRTGADLDRTRLQQFVERIEHFATERQVPIPEIAGAILAGDVLRPRSRATMQGATDGFDLPPIDPPTWEFEQAAALARVLDAAPGEPSEPAVDAPPEGANDVSSPPDPQGAQVPLQSATEKALGSSSAREPAGGKAVNFLPLFDQRLPPNLQGGIGSEEALAAATPVPAQSAETVPAESPIAAEAAVLPASEPGTEGDAVSELAAAFDSVPVPGADRAGAMARLSTRAKALAQSSLWLSEQLKPMAVQPSGASAALDAVRRDALALLAVDQLVSAGGVRRKVQVGEATAAQLRALQDEIGSFEAFSVEGEWCRVSLSEAAAAQLGRRQLLDRMVLAIAPVDSLSVWLPMQSQRLSVWVANAEDGSMCAVPDLRVAEAPSMPPTRLLSTGPGAMPVVQTGAPADAQSMPLIQLHSGVVALDPAKWRRQRATCFVAATPVLGLEWLAGAALCGGQSAVLIDPSRF
jgi:hypothetical protein